jgi:uncharacterized repeat protein (TIGR04138 family)
MNSAQRAMEQLLRRDTRYKLDAYVFVRDSLSFAQRNLINEISEDEEGSRHMTGQQLCEACRLYALEQFGYLAKLVLSSWGLRSTSDFGEVVYNLIEIKHMRKSDSDRREDFDDVYQFEDAFEPSFELLSPEEA